MSSGEDLERGIASEGGLADPRDLRPDAPRSEKFAGDRSATKRRKGLRHRGTLAFSWGEWGGFYLHRQRICLGWFAVTVVPSRSTR